MADKDARLEELIRRYGALIRGIVARVGGRAVAASRDDIEQTVIVNLWRQVEREQTIDHPASYIYRAAVRETVRAVRQELAREQPVGDANDVIGHVLDSDTPETRLQRAEQAAHLARIIAALAPDRGRAVRAHLAGYDVTEIMRLFGWSYQRARNLVARGMADVRRRLQAGGIDG